MKKEMFFFGIAVIALLFTLSGCQDSDGFSRLDGPGGLRATPHEGTIILQWNHVPDAYGYKVVRRDTVTNVSVVREQNTDRLWFMDTVWYGNQLEHNRRYEYTVLSLSTHSTKFDIMNGFNVVQNGSSSVSVNANIPAIDAAPVFGASDISYYTFTGADGNDMFGVRINQKPNLEYDVTYIIGTGSTAIELNHIARDDWWSEGREDDKWFEPVIAVFFPVFYGEKTVLVRAKYQGYYSNFTPVNVPLTILPPADLPSVTTATASTNFPNSGITIRWTSSDATTFEVYRVESRGIGSGQTPGQEQWNISSTTGNWTRVAGTPSQLTDILGDIIPNRYGINDNTANQDRDYIYAIIAVSGARRSAPTFIYY